MENTYTEGGGSDSSVITEQVRQGTEQVVQGTQQAVSQVAEGARQQAQSLLQRQKGQTTQTLHQIHTALTQTSQNLRNQNQDAAAGLIEGAAGRLDAACQYLESRDIGQLRGELEDFARSNAPVFLGGAFALGVLAARFLKSSSPPRQYGGQGHGGQYQQPGSYGSFRDYPPASQAQYSGSTGSSGGVPEATGAYPTGTSPFAPTGTREYGIDTGTDIERDPTGVNDGPTI